MIEGKTLYIHLHGGITDYSQHGDSLGTLMSKAQIALEKAKENGINSDYAFYTKDMRDKVQEHVLMEKDINEAYKNNEFYVFYQPFIDLQTNKLIGLEALLRRKKATGEVLGPATFIKLLEQMELMNDVGLSVVESVCKQLREWQDKGYSIVPVAINLSPGQFRDRSLPKHIMRILRRYKISPSMITLEITESVLMDDVENAKEIIGVLKRCGFSVAIDDFGKGYSSFGYLRTFSFNKLKIDISFIRNIVENEVDRAIVAGIVEISKALGLRIIAEGIETRRQFEIMKELGCDMGQGYLWDAPKDFTYIEDKYFSS